MIEKKIYSDGNIEDEILLHLKSYGSYDNDDMVDGAVFHNFAPCRENLFSWYPFKKNANLLEIGGGMGALTGLFCRKCKHVVSIEQSPKRAEIIKERYKNQKNLEVLCSDIFELKNSLKFDYIVVAGVLEYAAMKDGNYENYTEFLETISQWLLPNGKLLLAIENRFGLKYWCGSSEDHTGIPFDGISGYENNSYTTRYNSGGVRTFDKNELSDMLKHVGLNYQRWYYPLPDYKFPAAVFSDEKLPDISDIDAIKFTYSEESELIANEKKLYQNIIKNNVFPFFANSFLVEAQREKSDDYYIKYASLKRDYKEKYRLCVALDSDDKYIRTPISETSEKHLIESKKYLDEIENHGVNVIQMVKTEFGFSSNKIDNIRADQQFNIFLNENKIDCCFIMLNTLKADIEKSSEYIVLKEEKNAIEKTLDLQLNEIEFGGILKNGFVDMTFANSFYSSDGLIFFDQEWNIPFMPINFILYRSLKYAYLDSLQLNSFAKMLDITEKQMEIFDQYEEYMLKEMMNPVNCSIFDPKMYHQGLKALPCAKKMYSDKVKELNDVIKEKNKLYEENHFLHEENQYLYKEKNQLIQHVENLEQEVLNKKGHIELLLPAERELEVIKRSKMYKVMRFCCRFIDIVMYIPKKIARKCYIFWKILKRVNIPKLKIAFGYVKNEGILGAYNHLLKDFHQGELKSIKIDVNTEYEEIISLKECEVLHLPYFEDPLVSIVIPVFNQFTYTYYCIESIIKNSGNIKYEVILADDCSTDLTRNINQVVENLKIVKTENNLRFLRNCNNAAKEAKGKYILFLNNDTQVQPDWLNPLINLCEKDNAVGMVGSKLVYPDGTLQEAGGIIWNDGSGWNYGRNDDAMKPEFCYVKEVDYISGASIMIRNDLWKQLGGFDEFFAPAYCEDSDLAFQVRKAGYKVLYQPLSVVVHFEGKSNGTDLSSGVKKYQIENNLKLRKKWKDEFAQQYENGQSVFKARERGKGKKTILVIDHYVPQFDKDAGSKTTYQYLKMFVQKGYSVKFIGDNFFQDEPYTTVLQQLGIEVLYGPWYAEHWKEWIKENQRFIDFVYLNRPHISIKYIDFFKNETNIKCIYYGHDLHFLRLQREYELTGDTKLLQESEEWKKQELYIMRNADISYYPSCIEEQEIHKIDAQIPVKAITAYVYEQFRENIPADFTKREGIMFVGGFGHPPNEDAVLWFVEKVYPLINKLINIPFYIVGSKVTDKIKKLHGGNIVVKGFVSEEELNELYDSCKMVVVPLRYGAGVKGKVVEALYYGTPMVTTSVGAEGIEGIEDIIEIADDENSFANKVVELYNDNKRLENTLKKYQTFVKSRFSVDAVWKTVEEDFR